MLKIKDLMTHPVFSLKENDSLYSARSLMALQRIRHIPIVTVDNNFAGLITHRDILSATISQLAELDPETQKEIDAGIPIREVMQTDIATVNGETTLRDAAQTILNHKYGCLPVIENRKLIGIVTEADFLRLTINLMETLQVQIEE
ncbi:CBS domain-containing protein [Pseudodesulfovibrio piezophilus]|uniref:Putative signal transduction protein with CBS domains n=1 Tax=Pseudodesulfovibrio piezophilus (strain DSM 21447 / JCM 15486 / C1TLV30) TaxID=1322246 RepID=M1WLA9_PSEP2|nr:CBS domain-containing protein [Pseudodesulfovibrio piezophilus]CCH47545.1 putative signal transduction protein with CBS domains [Pseudodesulfovibrio piezophilus C1TLV30]